MHMWENLILPAIHDETISLQMKFIHEASHGGILVSEKISVFEVKMRQRCNFTRRDNEHVKLIAWRRMMKRKQVRDLAQTRDWEEKTPMGEDPSDPANDNQNPK